VDLLFRGSHHILNKSPVCPQHGPQGST
jgi:hypothetical protein